MTEPRTTKDSVIGNYRVGEQIGRGGMGTVYRGRHLNLPREVAIKIVRAPSAQDLRRQRSRFEREAFIQSQLDHPGIIKVYDYIVAQADYYIIMEYVEGCSLAELLAAHPRGIGITRSLDIFQQILAAVSYAHNFIYEDEAGARHTGIIHRDLKPANILVTPEDGSKITDFGIVKLIGADDTRTSNRPYGTPQYVSPEQAEGRELDRRSDIYSLGVILYELLTGSPPFGGRARADEIDGEDGSAGVGSRVDQPLRRSEILRAHISGAPRPPAELNPRIGVELQAALLRSLAKQPGERFPTAADFARALRSAARNDDYARADEATKNRAITTSENRTGDHLADADQAIVNPESMVAGEPRTGASAALRAALTDDAATTSRLDGDEPVDTGRTSYVTQPIGVAPCVTCGADAEPGDVRCRACGTQTPASPATHKLSDEFLRRGNFLSGRGARPLMMSTAVFAFWLLVVSCATIAIYAFLPRTSERARQTPAKPEPFAESPAMLRAQNPDDARPGDASRLNASIVRVAPQRVTVDSSFDGYNSEPLADGVTDTKRIRAMRYNRGNWASAERPGEHWIEYEFAAPVALANVYVYWGFDRDRFLPSRRIELHAAVDDSNDFRRLAAIEPRDDIDRAAFEFASVTTRKLRIVQPPQAGPVNRPFVMWVREVEAYALASADGDPK